MSFKNLVNIGSVDGLLPVGTKPSTERVFTYHQRRLVASNWAQEMIKLSNGWKVLKMIDKRYMLQWPNNFVLKASGINTRNWRFPIGHWFWGGHVIKLCGCQGQLEPGSRGSQSKVIIWQLPESIWVWKRPASAKWACILLDTDVRSENIAFLSVTITTSVRICSWISKLYILGK